MPEIIYKSLPHSGIRLFGQRKLWSRKGTAQDPKHPTSCLKHGGGHFRAWACAAANGICSILFIDDVSVDRHIKMNVEVYRALHSAHIQASVIELIG